jgi:hypothetical protein
MGDELPVQRIGKRQRMVSQPEMSVGVVDLKPAGDHANEKDGVEPVSEAHDACVPLDQRTRLR